MIAVTKGLQHRIKYRFLQRIQKFKRLFHSFRYLTSHILLKFFLSAVRLPYTGVPLVPLPEVYSIYGKIKREYPVLPEYSLILHFVILSTNSIYNTSTATSSYTMSYTMSSALYIQIQYILLCLLM